MSAGDDTLPRESIVAITGYKRPSEQLAELRALLLPRQATGEVILERPQYEHICKGDSLPANDEQVRPQVRAVR